MSQIAKSSLLVTVFTALGLGLGFLSNVVIAAKFGAGKDMDVFLAATTLPLFITSILSGSLNFTFIPVFAEYRTKEPSEIWKVVSSIINLNIIVTVGLCLIGILLAYPIMKVLTPGFDEQKLIKSVELLRWLFPIIIFTVINELMASVYYSNQRFVVPSLNKVISPLLTIIYVLSFQNYLSTRSIVFAMLSATFIQMVLLTGGCLRRQDFSYSFVFDYKHPGVIKIVKLMAPLILGMLVYRAVPIFDRYFLSMLPEGSISHIGYAEKLLSVIPLVVASGISISIFPLMSKYAAERKWNELKEIMSKGIRQVLFFIIPIIIILGTSGRSIVKLVFERGAFSPEDSIAVNKAFTIYLFSLIFSTANNLTNGYYVLKDTRTPCILGMISATVYVILCFMMYKPFGYLALPISYFFFYSFVIIHAIIIRKKLGGSGGKRILKSVFKFISVSIIIASVLYILNYFVDNVILANIFILASFIVYYFICYYVLQLEEAEIIHKRIISLIPLG